METSRIFITGLAACLIAASPLVNSQQVIKSYIGTATITKVRYHGSGFFGGCLAEVDVNVNTAGTTDLTGQRLNGGSCANNLVTFGCTGAFGTKADAKNAFDVAQLAYVTNTQVSIQVTNQDANGACFADFIMTR